jgi:hypothetical protein
LEREVAVAQHVISAVRDLPVIPLGPPNTGLYYEYADVHVALEDTSVQSGLPNQTLDASADHSESEQRGGSFCQSCGEIVSRWELARSALRRRR